MINKFFIIHSPSFTFSPDIRKISLFLFLNFSFFCLFNLPSSVFYNNKKTMAAVLPLSYRLN